VCDKFLNRTTKCPFQDEGSFMFLRKNMDPREKPRHENKEIEVEIGPKSLQKMCK
jgi:hypothetical protein